MSSLYSFYHTRLEEQQMITKFKVGDRVRINSNCCVKSWVGIEGKVIKLDTYACNIETGVTNTSLDDYPTPFLAYRILDLIKEPEVKHKFKVGDNVRYNCLAYSGWEGSTGIVASLEPYMQYRVLFNADSSAMKEHTKNYKHLVDEFTIELVEEQPMKQLIKPENYKDLKAGDEIEVVVKGELNYDVMGIISIISKKAALNCIVSVNDPNIQSIHKILPKATKLEVGDVLLSSNASSWNAEVVAIRGNVVAYFHNLGTDEGSFASLTKQYIAQRPGQYSRKSGIPIDWEATFS